MTKYQLKESWDVHEEVVNVFVNNKMEPVGRYCIQKCKDYLGLTALYIQAGFKHRGYGNYMLVDAIQTFQNQSEYPQLFVQVRKDSWMVEWYMKNGFTFHNYEVMNEVEYIWMCLNKV